MNAIPSLRLATAFALLAVSKVFAADPTPAPKTHVLFMGADIDVERNGSFHRVRDVKGDAFVIDEGGENKKIHMSSGSVNLKVNEQLKLTSESVRIDKLQADRGYTLGADPFRRFVQQQVGTSQMDIEAASQVNVVNAGNLAGGAGAYMAYAQTTHNPSVIAGAQTAMAAANQNANSSVANYNNTLNQGSAYSLSASSDVSRMERDADKEMYDALEISFVASAPRVISAPYVVVIAQYRAPDDKPGTHRNWIFAKDIEGIGTRPTHIYMKQGGLPPGYELLGYSFHLYDHDEELATTVSSKRVDLTTAEAAEYMVIDYITSHKNLTAPPKPALGVLPADFAQQVASGKLQTTYFVKVDKNGFAKAAYLDEACTQELSDTYAKAVLNNIRYKPALNNGKPIEGVAKINLSHLTRNLAM